MGKLFAIEISSFFPKSGFFNKNFFKSVLTISKKTLLLPNYPTKKAIFEQYLKQSEEEFEFKCRDGLKIQLSALPLLRTDYFRKYVQEKWNSPQKKKSISVEKYSHVTMKVFTDLLHDIQRSDVPLISLLELFAFLVEDNKYSKIYKNKFLKLIFTNFSEFDYIF